MLCHENVATLWTLIKFNGYALSRDDWLFTCSTSACEDPAVLRYWSSKQGTCGSVKATSVWLCVYMSVSLCVCVCVCVCLGNAIDQGSVNAASFHAGRTETHPRHSGVENVVVWSASSVARARTNSKNHSAVVLTELAEQKWLPLHWVSSEDSQQSIVYVHVPLPSCSPQLHSRSQSPTSTWSRGV